MAEASCGFVTGRELLALAEEAADLRVRGHHSGRRRDLHEPQRLQPVRVLPVLRAHGEDGPGVQRAGSAARDRGQIGLVEEEYQLLKRDFELIGKELPENTYKSDLLLRRLDCAVLQHLFERTDHEYKIGVETVGPFDSARGLFSEGERIYPNAGFKKKTHVQICVRNPNCIKGYFNPMQRDSGWPIP
jgi:hypothetical protein